MVRFLTTNIVTVLAVGEYNGLWQPEAVEESRPAQGGGFACLEDEALGRRWERHVGRVEKIGARKWDRETLFAWRREFHSEK
jgi:hypothetical protein